VIRFNYCCSGSTGCVIGHSGLHTGMNEAVLLEVPGLHVKFRFAGPRTEGLEANTKVRHERCCIEYPFQFLVWQLVELLHVLSAFLDPKRRPLLKWFHPKSQPQESALPASDEVTSECMVSIIASIGQSPASVTYAPPSGKSGARTNDQIANTWPNFRRPPSALVDANRTKNPIMSQTVAGIRLKKKHISRHLSS
jgi:hypothetical protein